MVSSCGERVLFHHDATWRCHPPVELRKVVEETRVDVVADAGVVVEEGIGPIVELHSFPVVQNRLCCCCRKCRSIDPISILIQTNKQTNAARPQTG